MTLSVRPFSQIPRRRDGLIPREDRLRWYCPNSTAHAQPHIMREIVFHCTDLGTQLKPHISVRSPFRLLSLPG